MHNCTVLLKCTTALNTTVMTAKRTYRQIYIHFPPIYFKYYTNSLVPGEVKGSKLGGYDLAG